MLTSPPHICRSIDDQDSSSAPICVESVTAADDLFSGAAADCSTDIASFGLILWELVTGEVSQGDEPLRKPR